jgi:type II secretory pathway pseudopilin PulG
MNRCAPFRQGAFRPERAFTLLETCIVLLIIAILLGVMMPSIQSAFVENAVREDSRQIALMVKTAMLQSTDEHRDYVIDLSTRQIDLRPSGPSGAAAAPGAESPADDSPDDEADQSYTFNTANKLLIPDPEKAGAWISMPATSWLFRPGDLCPATKVRLARGTAYLEMNFNALTGNVEDETAYFP